MLEKKYLGHSTKVKKKAEQKSKRMERKKKMIFVLVNHMRKPHTILQTMLIGFTF